LIREDPNDWLWVNEDRLSAMMSHKGGPEVPIQRAAQHSIESTNLADLLERILDKGIVIAGDIKISLVDVELLTIQLRLVICSVDKAKEMGMDWWVNNPCFSRGANNEQIADSLARMEKRLERLEGPLREDPGSLVRAETSPPGRI
jgi:hypothetical protein